MKTKRKLNLRITPSCIKYHAGRSNALENVMEQITGCYFKLLNKADKDGNTIEIQFIVNEIS